jgi:hypothetical protein
MGLFDIFKSKPNIQDTVFGELKLTSGNNSFFSGRQIFAPLKKEVEIIIMTTENVVTPEQHKFYSELQTNYNEYKSKMTPIIEDTFKNAIDNFSIVDFDKEFKLTTIMIPDFNEKPLVWNLSFETVHDLDHIFSVDFNDYEAIDVQIDG